MNNNKEIKATEIRNALLLSRKQSEKGLVKANNDVIIAAKKRVIEFPNNQRNT